jgi:hypothetical protein
MPAKDNAKYTVGFGKPPRRTRFKKGRSGNPKGRPRGSRTSLTLLQQALSELVVVTENGQRKQITKGEAMLKQLANKAASGDPRAMQMLLGEIRSLEDHLESSRADLESAPGESGIVQEQAGEEEDLDRLTDAELKQLEYLLEKARGIENVAAAIEATVEPTDAFEAQEDDDV